MADSIIDEESREESRINHDLVNKIANIHIREVKTAFKNEQASNLSFFGCYSSIFICLFKALAMETMLW